MKSCVKVQWHLLIHSGLKLAENFRRQSQCRSVHAEIIGLLIKMSFAGEISSDFQQLHSHHQPRCSRSVCRKTTMHWDWLTVTSCSHLVDEKRLTELWLTKPKQTRRRAGTSTRWHFAFALYCHSNATRAPIGNPPNTAQLGGTPYHSPKLHPGRCGVSAYGRGQTNRQTRVTNIHFASSTTHAKCNNNNTADVTIRDMSRINRANNVQSITIDADSGWQIPVTDDPAAYTGWGQARSKSKGF